MTWKLLEGDCLTIMPTEIEDQTIDMILCDLPYGTTACKWDTIIPFKDLWCEYERIIKDNGAIVLTASQPFTSALVMSNPKLFKYEWIWNKNIGSNFFNVKHQPLKVHESVLVFGKGATSPVKHDRIMKYNPQMEEGKEYSYTRTDTCNYVFHDKSVAYSNIRRDRYPKSLLTFKKENCGHPTQKPVALFEYLIKTYTNENDLVLDNCAGSGTTGVACEITNRNSILIEQEPEYCEIIKNRLSDINMEQYQPTRTHKPLTAF